MIDLVIWGVVIIIGTSISAIGVVIGIYFMLTKTRPDKGKSEVYTINDQKEIK
jgi:hypothetical protein